MNANQNPPSPQDGKVIDEVILIAQKIHKAFPNLEDRGFVETIFLTVIELLYPK